MYRKQPIKHVIKGITDIIIFVVVNIWDVAESVLFVGGVLLCIMLFDPWPMKFVYMVFWVAIVYAVSKAVRLLEKYRNQDR